MTRKESLLVRNYELRNELRSLRGEELIDIAEATNGWKFHREVKESLERDLRDSNERLEISIANQKKENELNARKEAFFNTPEGKDFKESLEGEIKAIEESLHNRAELQREKLNSWVKEFLGQYWQVSNYNSTYISFQIFDEDKNDRVFGSSMDVYIEIRSWVHSGERVEVNVGTMGCFNPFEDDIKCRARFYSDFGKFLSDKEKLNELKLMMFDYDDEMSNKRDQLRELKLKLNNPFSE